MVPPDVIISIVYAVIIFPPLYGRSHEIVTDVPVLSVDRVAGVVGITAAMVNVSVE